MSPRGNTWSTILVLLALPLFVTGCGGGGSSAGGTSNTTISHTVIPDPEPDPQPQPQPQTTLTLSGAPTTKAYEAIPYTFTPTVSYNGTASLTFSITNAPTWAAFNLLTGELSGVPANRDVSTTSGIIISASDGTIQAALTTFNLTVESTTAHLSWNAPTTRDDGSPLPLAELVGYRVYAGTAPETLIPLVEINDPITTEYTITNLTPATYYYAVSARNSYGTESGLSVVVSKTIN